MKKKRFSEEQIVRIVREAESTIIEIAARHPGVSEQSIYRWKRQCGQMAVADVRALRQLRQENARLKKVLAERDVEVEVMKELHANKWYAHEHDGRSPTRSAFVGSVRVGSLGSAQLPAPGWGMRPRGRSGRRDWQGPCGGGRSALPSEATG